MTTPDPDRAPVDARLAEAQDRFIASWGQMGSTWGISRTMAEIHALLFITGRPLCTDEVMDRLRISRGNASMSLRALLDWGIVSRVHKRGDRKEYYEADQDVWTLTRKVIRERLKREIHPVLASLAEIRDLTRTPDEVAPQIGRGNRPAPAPSPADTTASDPAAQGDHAAPASPEEHNSRLDAMLALLETIDLLGQQFVQASGDELRETASALSRG